MSKKLTRRVYTKHKVKVPDNRPLPEPVDTMVAPVLPRAINHEQHEKYHPLGSKVSPFSMADVSRVLPTAGSSAVYSHSSEMSRTESSSRPTSRSTCCSGYDSAEESSGTFIDVHDMASDFGESGTSFMSWSDEVDMDTTQKLQDMYDSLERFLYDEGEFPSNMGSDLLEECLLWKETFTYKRSKPPDSAIQSLNVHASQESDTVDYDGTAMGSKCELSQEVLKEKVRDQVMKNLSSHLLSNIIQSLATGVGEIRTKSLETQKARKASRSRSRSRSPKTKSKSNYMPALVNKTTMNNGLLPKPVKGNTDQILQVVGMPIHEETQNICRRSNSNLVDRWLGSSVQTLRHVSRVVPDNASRIPPTKTVQSLPIRNVPVLPLQPLDNPVARSAMSRSESYPATSDRKLSALSSVFAGRKSPRQEAILKSLQEERVKHSAKLERSSEAKSAVQQQNHVASKYKPPWIGFANITLPPINHSNEANKEKVSRKNADDSNLESDEDFGKEKASRRSGLNSRNRKVLPNPLGSFTSTRSLSPIPFEVHGRGLGRLQIAKKVVENISQEEKSARNRSPRKGTK